MLRFFINFKTLDVDQLELVDKKFQFSSFSIIKKMNLNKLNKLL